MDWYDDFIDTGDVSDFRILLIVGKIRRGVKLSPEEVSVYSVKSGLIEKILKEEI
jgi:hypothetical protein